MSLLNPFSFLFWFLLGFPVALLAIFIFLHYTKGKSSQGWQIAVSVLLIVVSFIFWELQLKFQNPSLHALSSIQTYSLFIVYPVLAWLFLLYLKKTILSQKRLGLYPLSWKITIALSMIGTIMSIAYMLVIVSSSHEESVWYGILLIPIFAGVLTCLLFIAGYALFMLLETTFRIRAFDLPGSFISIVLLVLCGWSIITGTRYAYFMKAAENPSTSPEQFRYIYRHYEGNYIMLAKNPSTPADVLVALVNSEDKFVAGRAISHPNMPVEALVEIAGGDDIEIIGSVAGNPNTPADILLQIAARQDLIPIGNNDQPWDDSRFQIMGILIGLADNPNTPGEVLWQIATRPDILPIDKPVKPGVRNHIIGLLENLAGNTNTPPEVLRQIAERPDTQPTRENRSLGGNIILYKNNDVFNALARNPSTPLDVLEKVADFSQDNHIASNLGENPNSSCMLLESLLPSESSNKWKPITIRYNKECVKK